MTVAGYLGVAPSQATQASVDRWVAEGLRETEQVDWKRSHYPPARGGGSHEVAKDVASMANHRGGVIVIGVEERERVATAATPVRLEEARAQAIGSAVHRWCEPPVQGVTLHSIPSGDDPSAGWLVIEVPASPARPHAVVDGDRQALRYPLRQDAQTVWMTEHQVAEAYRRRFEGAADQRRTLDDLDGAQMLEHLALDTGWLVVKVVPDGAGRLAVDRAGLRAAHVAWLGLTRDPFGYLMRGSEHSEAAVDGIVIGTRSEGRWIQGCAQLDRTGACVIATPLVHVREEVAVLYTSRLVSLAAWSSFVAAWHLERAGATGRCLAAADILPPAGDHQMVLQQFRRHGFADQLGYPVEGGIQSPARVLDLTDRGAVHQVALTAAYELVVPIMQAFGIAEPNELDRRGVLTPIASQLQPDWLTTSDGE